MPTVTMPVPPPEPIPGGGGPKSYQSKFNTAYYKSRRPELQPFFYGRPGAQPGTELTPDEKELLADQLYTSVPSVPFDEQIEMQGWEPYQTMYSRSQVYWYTRVPVGTGTAPIVGVVDMEDLRKPVGPGYLLVSVDIADFPPYQG